MDLFGFDAFEGPADAAGKRSAGDDKQGADEKKSRKQRKRDGKDDHEAAANKGDTCDMCEKRAAKKRQKRCGSCLADIQAARRDAEKSGKKELFLQIFREGGQALQDFLHEFVKANPDRRPFQNRSRFDWIRYETAVKLQKALRLGYKALMYDKVDFLDFKMNKKAFGRQEALDAWDAELQKARHRDYEGRGGSVRIPVRVEDFIIGEELYAQEVKVTKGFKQVKHGEGTDDAMKDAALANFADFEVPIESSSSSNLFDYMNVKPPKALGAATEEAAFLRIIALQ